MRLFFLGERGGFGFLRGETNKMKYFPRDDFFWVWEMKLGGF